MFHFVLETLLAEGPSKEAHLEPTDSFRLTQTRVCSAMEPHSSGERRQTKQRTGK